MMVGHLEVPVLEPKRGVPSSLSRKVVHDLLTQEMKFQGLVFTDALAMKGVSTTDQTVCLQALKAGHDLLLVPRRIKEEVDAVLDAVKSGELTEAEIEAKCRKVLTYKYALGLSKKPVGRLSGLGNRINTAHPTSKGIAGGCTQAIARLSVAIQTYSCLCYGTSPGALSGFL